MVNICLVDDNASTIKLYSKLMNLWGFKIYGICTNGKEAVLQYLNSQIKPDIIIMDYQMPVMDGIKATEEILKSDETAKIIICSGDSTIKKRALSSGAINYLVKPFKMTILKSTIMNIINSSSSINLDSSESQLKSIINPKFFFCHDKKGEKKRKIIFS